MTGRTGGHDTLPHPFLVLRSSLGTHSLWPAALKAPVGWPVAHGPAVRRECLDFINRTPSPGPRLRSFPPVGPAVPGRPRRHP